VARTATLAYTDATLPAIRARAGQGVERALAADPLLAAGLMVRAGSVVHAGLARDVGMLESSTGLNKAPVYLGESIT
jgi:alanine dehydrogenase